MRETIGFSGFRRTACALAWTILAVGIPSGAESPEAEGFSVLTGTIWESVSSSPLNGIHVTAKIWRSDGTLIQTVYPGEFGLYEVEGLAPGTYYVTTAVGSYRDELYDDIPCEERGSAPGCDLQRGTAINLRAGLDVHDINFFLDPVGGISGAVRDDVGPGRPLANVAIDVWTPARQRVVRVKTDATGRYQVDLERGTYFLSTDNGQGATDEVYNNLPCPEGSAAAGRCDPTRGQALTVRDRGQVSEIDFVLAKPSAPQCSPTPTRLCLEQGRFAVEMTWEDFAGKRGSGTAVPLTDAAGYFWFFNSANVEAVVKVLNACTLPSHHFWVFAGGLTNVGTELIVTDLLTGEQNFYRNSRGTAFAPITDTRAFDTCDAALSTPAKRTELAAELTEVSPEFASAHELLLGSCTPTATTLCLSGGRFEVEASWRTLEGNFGLGQAVPLSGDTGYFWFFNRDNLEVVVKVLNACDLAPFHRFWVFAAGLTNLEVILRVTDTVSGEIKEYPNPQQTPFQPVQDLRAFATCP